MDVILLERVEKLGQMGDTVAVKDGYARNFLLPRGKAMRATPANKAYFETQRKEIEAQNLKRKNEAESVAEKVGGAHVVLIRSAGESGQLYGSVNARDIAEALTGQGFKIDRSQVIIDKPIKTLGLYDIAIRLHAEVTVTVEVNVARSEAEAETQRETGRAVIGIEEAAEAAGAEMSAEELVEELLEEEVQAEALEEVAEGTGEPIEDADAEDAAASGEDADKA